MNARRPAGHVYDITVTGLQDWHKLADDSLDVIVDPFVFRMGQFFLEGKEAGSGRWEAIGKDLGALVTFFDLVVLHERLPAFNYPDTFDRPDVNQTGEYRDRLGAVLNAEGDKALVHVDVEHYLYREVKSAALDQLGRRMDEGPFVPQVTADEILIGLDAIQYEWEPRLETLEPRLPAARDQRLARFLLGQLVFSGYAQQTGAPHLLAPRRSLFLAAVGMRAELPAGGDAAVSESAIYEELAKRCRDAGAGWRDDELPWTPSFLPFLLERVDPYKDGPDVLLRRAKELRDSKAVKRYRSLRRMLTSEDAARSRKAQKDLARAVDRIATDLRTGREELEFSRYLAVEVLPKALGAAAGAAGGFIVAGPAGGVAGAVVGAVGEEALKGVHARLWGWTLDKLPFRSARKLLSRSVRAEYEIKGQLETKLTRVWENARR